MKRYGSSISKDERKRLFAGLRKQFSINKGLSERRFYKELIQYLPIGQYRYRLMPNSTPYPLPLYAMKVSAGNPTAVEDMIEKEIELGEYLAPHPQATFLVRVEGDSMVGAGIYENDLLVVDRLGKPAHGKIVVALIHGEFTVKRLKLAKNEIWLVPENPHYSAIKINSEMDFKIWGVVLHSIRSF